ncbi:MAG: putative metal-binding motif-containing protein [Myxococcota bacterium]
MQWVVIMGLAHAAGPPTGATGDTGVAGDTTVVETADTGTGGTTPMPTGDTGMDVDADEDGFTVAEGDCNDADDEIFPGAEERCEDRIDNDCDRLFDEDCDTRIRMASLRGAGGCSDNTGSAMILLLPLMALRPRRGASRRGDG